MAPSIANSGPRSYAQDELRCIRDTLPLDRRVLEVLSARADIACIVRLPEDKRKFSRTVSCPGQSLSNITNRRRPFQQSSMGNSTPTDDNEEPTITEVVTSRDLPPTQWNLRRRDSSDRSQPYSAPTGSIAQQSENFQRFYRAVVSPTHVRVTAGGRIVPNTRTAGPPAFEWNNDKRCFESRKPPPETDLTLPQSSTWNHSMPFPPGLSPMMPGGFMSPYPFLPPGNLAAPFPSPRLAGFGGHNTVITSAEPHRRLASDGPENSGALPQPIKISPPTQFDQTKPFVYNGQLIYPVPPPQHPLPMSMTLLGNPNFAPQTPAGHTGSFAPHPHPHFPIPLPNFPNPMMFPAGQPLPIPMPHPAAGHDNTPMMHPMASPMMPMPPLSDFTRGQIQGLRRHLNIIETQAANSFQAAEQQYLQSQRAAVLAQINGMEAMLQAQLAQENPNNVRSQRNSNVSEDLEVTSGRQNSIGQSTQSTALQSRAEQPHGKKGEAHTKDEVDSRKTSDRSDSMNKSRLSAAAAMAPPFQPRAHSSTVVSYQPSNHGDDRSVVSNSPIEPDETQSQIETRLLSRASTNWGQDANNKSIVVMSGPPGMPKAQSMREHKPQIELEKLSIQRSSPFNHRSDAPPQHSAHSSGHHIANQPVPYLVGVLPQGLSGGDANLADLVYPRPLTDLEVRARHLYWGRAPRAMQTGLPKFDGKDFYPPSPVKDTPRMPAYGTWSGPVYNNSSTGQIMDFDQLFMEPGVPGHQSPSPERFPPQHANYASLPTNGFMAAGGLGIHELTDASRYPTQQSYKPTAQSRPETPTSTTRAAAMEDFSNLFLEPGVPGYQSPDRSKFPQQTMQLKMKARTSGMSFSSKRTPKGKSPEVLGAETGSDSHSTHSTVDFHLTPLSDDDPQSADPETSFAERVASFSNKPFSCRICSRVETKPQRP
ncbi:hypothetical protein BJ875DRAFT_105611 [Amylocarpus encephaloides]|uniref:Uncharacterized protein n=1 Tax=Amylocarpus encephaloides TaxID=45428 RepID=A0A9P8C370_9HELO|nr:hypothetical protein BJ875DRAFT_105611 [Amylocarpus encephaloides]